MSNRKRVTLTFEIDDHYGYNDEAFMRHDFLQELSCCVNDPYEDTFVMKVENADVPQEMSAVDYARDIEMLCAANLLFGHCNQNCPIFIAKNGQFCTEWIMTHPQEAVSIVERWAKEHPDAVTVTP